MTGHINLEHDLWKLGHLIRRGEWNRASRLADLIIDTRKAGKYRRPNYSERPK